MLTPLSPLRNSNSSLYVATLVAASQENPKIAGVRNLVSSLVRAISTDQPYAQTISAPLSTLHLHNPLLLARLKGILKVRSREDRSEELGMRYS